MECEVCDRTRSIRLPVDKLSIQKEESVFSYLGLNLNDTVEMVKTRAGWSNIVWSALGGGKQNCQQRSKLSNISVKKSSS